MLESQMEGSGTAETPPGAAGGAKYPGLPPFASKLSVITDARKSRAEWEVMERWNWLLRLVGASFAREERIGSSDRALDFCSAIEMAGAEWIGPSAWFAAKIGALEAEAQVQPASKSAPPKLKIAKPRIAHNGNPARGIRFASRFDAAVRTAFAGSREITALVSVGWEFFEEKNIRIAKSRSDLDPRFWEP
ncbi:MAG TPA: hypothetical protein VGI42_00705 [Chthoniobacterales bacterium]